MPANKKYSLRSNYKRHYKRKNRLKRIYKALALSITGLVLFSSAFYIYALSLSVFKPFVKASDGISFSDKTYNSANKSTFLFIHIDDTKNRESLIKDLSVYKLYTAEKQAVVINFDVQKSIPDMEDTKIKNLYALKNYGEFPKSVDTVSNFVKATLAINIDYYFVYDNAFIEMLEEHGIKIDPANISASLSYSKIFELPELIKFASDHTFTNLNALETLKIISDVKSLNNDSTKTIDFTDINSRTIKQFDDKYISFLSVNEIKDYRDTVIVLNSTDTAGLASFGARIAKNTGGVVIETDNLQKEYKESAIYTSKKDSKLVAYLASALNCKNIYDTNEFTENVFLASRADILLVMGKDTADYFK